MMCGYVSQLSTIDIRSIYVCMFYHNSGTPEEMSTKLGKKKNTMG